MHGKTLTRCTTHWYCFPGAIVDLGVLPHTRSTLIKLPTSGSVLCIVSGYTWMFGRHAWCSRESSEIVYTIQKVSIDGYDSTLALLLRRSMAEGGLTQGGLGHWMPISASGFGLTPGDGKI